MCVWENTKIRMRKRDMKIEVRKRGEEKGWGWKRGKDGKR